MALKLPAAMHGFSLLRCSDADLFQIIDSALVVAALRCPKELEIRRDGIARQLFKGSTATDSDLRSKITDRGGNCGSVSSLSTKQVLDDEVFKKVVSETGEKKMKGQNHIKLPVLNRVNKASKIPQDLGGARKAIIQETVLGKGDGEKNMKPAAELNCAKKIQHPVRKRDLLDDDDASLLSQKLEASKRKLKFQDAKNMKRTRLVDFHHAPRPKKFLSC